MINKLKGGKTMKHTKGPWEVGCLVENDYEARHVEIKKVGALNLIARAYYGKTDEEAATNAHLIAAAPELLEACNDVLKRFGGSVREYEAMTAGQKLAIERTVEAIRKAQGN